RNIALPWQKNEKSGRRKKVRSFRTSSVEQQPTSSKKRETFSVDRMCQMPNYLGSCPSKRPRSSFEYEWASPQTPHRTMKGRSTAEFSRASAGASFTACRAIVLAQSPVLHCTPINVISYRSSPETQVMIRRNAFANKHFSG